jgi:hypothetical protein
VCYNLCLVPHVLHSALCAAYAQCTGRVLQILNFARFMNIIILANARNPFFCNVSEYCKCCYFCLRSLISHNSGESQNETTIFCQAVSSQSTAVFFLRPLQWLFFLNLFDTTQLLCPLVTTCILYIGNFVVVYSCILVCEYSLCVLLYVSCAACVAFSITCCVRAVHRPCFANIKFCEIYEYHKSRKR